MQKEDGNIFETLEHDPSIVRCVLDYTVTPEQLCKRPNMESFLDAVKAHAKQLLKKTSSDVVYTIYLFHGTEPLPLPPPTWSCVSVCS